MVDAVDSRQDVRVQAAREAADALPHSAAESAPRAERTARGPHGSGDLRFETYRVEVGRDHGVEVRNLVRAVTLPYPGAFTAQASGGKLIVWESRVAEGAALSMLLASS